MFNTLLVLFLHRVSKYCNNTAIVKASQSMFVSNIYKLILFIDIQFLFATNYLGRFTFHIEGDGEEEGNEEVDLLKAHKTPNITIYEIYTK